MSDTTFVAGTTRISADWLNAINDFYYTLFTGATTAADARTALGLGSIVTQNANNVAITGGSVTGITDLAVADGGTGSSNASDARTALGAAASGAVTASNLTMATARLLGRTTASTGAIEEITVGSGLTLSSGSLSATATSAATESEQEAATSTAVFVSPGRQHFHPSAAKCWLRCDAAGGITSSYNITSISDGGPGVVGVTIATDFINSNWCGVVSNTNAGGTAQINSADTLAAGSVVLRGWSDFSATPADCGAYFFIAFGEV